MSAAQTYYLASPFMQNRMREAPRLIAAQVAQLQQVAEALVHAVERLEAENARLRADLTQVQTALTQIKGGGPER